MIDRFLSYYQLTTLLAPFGILFAVACLIFIVYWRKPFRRSFRITAYVILMYCGLEFGVCRSVYFYAGALRVLDLDQVGWRQKDTLYLNLARLSKPTHAPILAVGTSQTGAIYMPYSKTNPNLQVDTLAGLSLVEFPLYYDLFLEQSPRTILLYVSEFDLRTEPRVEGMKLAPPQWPTSLWRASRLLHETGAASVTEIADLWMANLISPYRYQFVFKGIVSRLAREGAASRALQTLPDSVGEDDPNDVETQFMAGQNDQWFPTNVTALESFLDWSERHQIKVVIVEGQYDPEVRSKSVELRAEAHAAVQKLCSAHRNARYLTNAETGEFAAEDYRDITHVLPAAGIRFAKRVIALVEAGEQEPGTLGQTASSASKAKPGT